METEYNRIDSWAKSIADPKPPFLFFQAYIETREEIHCQQNGKVDIRRI